MTTGGIIMFPCTWSYLHKGNPVKSGSGKYVLGTFLNYLTTQQFLSELKKNLESKIG